MEERNGILLDPKKCLRMEVKRNTGVGWTRSLEVVKHLEMHVRGKGPPVNLAFRDKMASIIKKVKRMEL